MPQKEIILLTISWYIGLTAFVGGWLIFLTWTACRYFFAFDFLLMVMVGFCWMFVFFCLCPLALGLLFIYVLVNRKQLHKKMLFTTFIILINIASVLFIIDTQHRISNLVFIKLDNQSGKEFKHLILQGKNKSWKLGDLSEGSTMIFHYDPDFFTGDGRSYLEPDSLKLIYSHHGKTASIDFPEIDLGSCHTLILDGKLTIQ